jgi:hypothetical protein
MRLPFFMQTHYVRNLLIFYGLNGQKHRLSTHFFDEMHFFKC